MGQQSKDCLSCPCSFCSHNLLVRTKHDPRAVPLRTQPPPSRCCLTRGLLLPPTNWENSFQTHGTFRGYCQPLNYSSMAAIFSQVFFLLRLVQVRTVSMTMCGYPTVHCCVGIPQYTYAPWCCQTFWLLWFENTKRLIASFAPDFTSRLPKWSRPPALSSRQHLGLSLGVGELLSVFCVVTLIY